MRIHARKIALALAASLSVSGCVSNQNPSNMTVQNSADAFYGTYMFIRNCPEMFSSPPTGGIDNINTKSIDPILGVIAANAAKAGIDILGRAIKKAATDDINQTRVLANITSPETLQNKCIDIIRARFQLSSESDKGVYEYGALEGTGIKPAGVKVVGYPDLRITLLPVVKNSTITFIPLSLEYSGKTPTDPRTPKNRELAIAIGFATLDKDASKDTFIARTIDFGLINQNKQSINKSNLNSNAKISFTKGNSPFSANQTQFLQLKETGPISIAAIIIETKRAGQIAKFWNDVFEASEKEMKTAAETAITELEIFKTKEELDLARWNKQEAENTAKSNFYNALATIATKQAALDSLCAGTPSVAEIYKAQNELLSAHNAAKIFQEKAGIATPVISSKDPTGVCS